MGEPTFHPSSLPLKQQPLEAGEKHAEGRRLVRIRKCSFGSAVCSERIYPPDHPVMKAEESQTVPDTRGEDELCSACAGKPTPVTPPNLRPFTAANNNNNNNNNGYQKNPTAQPERSSQLLQ
jgi:hypothetical protein